MPLCELLQPLDGPKALSHNCSVPLKIPEKQPPQAWLSRLLLLWPLVRNPILSFNDKQVLPAGHPPPREGVAQRGPETMR